MLRRGERVRALPLDDFYIDYMKNRARAGRVRRRRSTCRCRAPDAQFRAYKISKRFDYDISAVCAGVRARARRRPVARRARFAFGGMAATPKRARAAPKPRSSASRGPKPPRRPRMHALADDLPPLTDMRASAAYRLQVAQNLLRRFWLETRLDAAAGRGRRQRVRARMRDDA